ncbi:MAG: dihydrofolate reductase [Parcubacteria group bacterium GW2011_GWA1_50_14]|uniref:Dihydrofolate reductase n=1 Tax=Candidatus Liptonbacteria bacterium GWB1_49_6 TaxID=1798644 RepID=A0A1G2C7Y3_9BACT|nr:MAG: dihydrofolate reductase [Parcubacteria group bacterium GW2011_GWA1_50_14]OGY96607.1 MAG: hypothetical protein A2122_02735 [Candidatus Liptonbacteria bacterium GWB1_49_6]
MISLIAAVGENRAIGFQGKLPWRLPADMKHFRELTTGHPVIMGRITYESIGKPLPERKNIVISDKPNYEAPGCVVASSLQNAVREAGSPSQISPQSETWEGKGETFVIGGGRVYTEALPYADRMYLTLVHVSPEADVFFPEFDEAEWHVTKTEKFPKDEKNEYAYDFLDYERVQKQDLAIRT